MAVRINPCHGCPLREGCEQRDEFRRRVSGLGLRSATFRCAKLDEALRPGRRVMVPTPRLEVARYWGEPPELVTRRVAVPATITGSGDAKFSCVIDAGNVWARECDKDAKPEDVDKYRFRRRMPARRIIRFLDEPDKDICGQGRVLVGIECDRPNGESCYCKEMQDMEGDLQDVEV